MPVRNANLQNIGAVLQKAGEKKEVIPSVQPEAPRQKVLGRKKRLATKRENAITIYCTDEMIEALDEVKYNNRVERQRVIQAALSEFLKAYYDSSKRALNTTGFDIVRQFEDEITID